jgi:lysophospholipase L1-like esterase
MDVVTLGAAKADAKRNYRPLNFGGAGIVFTGDSHTNRGIVDENDPTINAPTVTGIMLGASSFAVQLVARSGKLKYLYNAARSGEDTNQILARFDADVLSRKPRVVHLIAGTNDIGGSIPLATTIANVKEMINRTQKAGALFVFGTIPPRDENDTYLPLIDKMNLAYKGLAARTGALLIDYHSVLTDPANGHYTYPYSSDGVHPTSVGAKAMAKLAVAQLNPLLPSFAAPVSHSQQANSTNLLTNSCFITDSNADGVADGLTLGGTATTSTASLITDPDVIGKAQQLVFTGASQRNFVAAITPSGKFAVGDRIAFAGKVKATLEAGVGKFDMRLNFNASTGPITKLAPMYQWDQDTDGWVTFYIEGTVPTGTTLFYVQMNAISGAGTVAFAQIGVWNLTRDAIPTT